MEEDPYSAPDVRTADVRIAVAKDVQFVYSILEEMESSAKARGTGIARRSVQALCRKIYEGKAVIAIGADGGWAGFSYIESWGRGEYVSNSGLIVRPAYRGSGVAKSIKSAIFGLSRERYPDAAIFSITTGAAVMKMNHALGFVPVTYSEITDDGAFWDQCQQCINYPILEGQGRKKCLCTAMLFREKAPRPAVRVAAGVNRVAAAAGPMVTAGVSRGVAEAGPMVEAR